MQKKTTIFILTAILITGFVIVRESAAQRGRRGGGQGQGPMQNCFLDVNLSTEQKEKINSVRRDFFKETAGLKADIYRERMEMKVIMMEQDIDEKKAMKMQDKISDLKKEYKRKKLQAKIKARKALTPEQIAQLPPGCSFGLGGMKGCGGSGRGRKGKGGPGCGPGFGRDMGGW